MRIPYEGRNLVAVVTTGEVGAFCVDVPGFVAGFKGKEITVEPVSPEGRSKLEKI